MKKVIIYKDYGGYSLPNELLIELGIYDDTEENYQKQLELEKDRENKQLKNNWNKLKEWTKKAVDKYYDCDLRVEMIYKNVLNKMQELESSDKCE